MALYLVSYDIAEKNHDYQSLWDRLADLKAIRVLYSEWLIADQRVSIAKPLADDLAKHIMQGDRLLVQEIGRDAAWISLHITDAAMIKLVEKCRF